MSGNSSKQGVRPLPIPRDVADLTVSEATELKVRVDLIKGTENDLATAQASLQKLARIHQVLILEQNSYMQHLIREHSLPLDGQYRLNEVNGKITLLAEKTEPVAEESPTE